VLVFLASFADSRVEPVPSRLKPC